GGGGDGDQLLSARAGAAERACRGLREMRTAGNHRVDGADAGYRHGLYLDAVLGPQVEIARDIAGGEGQAERRIGQNDLLVRLGMQRRDVRGRQHDSGDHEGRHTHRKFLPADRTVVIMERARRAINATPWQLCPAAWPGTLAAN